MSPSPKKPPLAPFLGKSQVLVVEPAINYRISLKQFLANLNVKNVKLVGSVAEARRSMLAMKIGLFIVEWELGDISGLQFCRDLHKEPQYRDTPFLLTSVENLRNDVMLASEVSIDAYLLKPFSYEDFCAQIAQILKLRTAPTPLTQLLAQADRALEEGKTEEASQAYTNALSLQASSARALVGLGRIAALQSDAVQALIYYEMAVAANPEYIDAHRVMLDIHTSNNNRPGVLHAASQLARLSPGNPSYALALAKAHLDAGNLESAEDFFRKTVKLSPRLADAYKGLGHVYMAREEYEKARKSFKKALDLDDKDISTLNSLGLAYIHLGHFKAGIEKYQYALNLDPSNHRVLFNLGQAFERQGDAEKAHRYYSQALQYRPDYDKAVRGLERLAKLRAMQRTASGETFDFGLHGEDDQGEKF